MSTTGLFLTQYRHKGKDRVPAVLN